MFVTGFGGCVVDFVVPVRGLVVVVGVVDLVVVAVVAATFLGLPKINN